MASVSLCPPGATAVRRAAAEHDVPQIVGTWLRAMADAIERGEVVI